MGLNVVKSLIQKYSIAGPRYTSYPTAPQFNDHVGNATYRERLQAEAGKQEPMGMYVHIPFCEALCYYCGCNIQITKDHERSVSYLKALQTELHVVAKHLGNRRQLGQISWGGGTPTFLKVSELESLYQAIVENFDVAPGAEISIEIDPRVTTFEQLSALRALGFNRVSLGVQDFNPEVQKAIHREQSLEMTQTMLHQCRELGFRGINFDFIYGLPHQTVDSFEKSIDALIRVRPDRIALYNYAHLPGLLKHQQILEKYPMPSAEMRVDIFSMAFEKLTAAGYHDIGMDHFAVAEDDLYQALQDGRLYRNFMGYTVQRGTDALGIGASAIGEVGQAYFQNIKEPKRYEESITDHGLATWRGFTLKEEDVKRKWVIQHLMCQFFVSPKEYELRFGDCFEEHFAKELLGLQGFYEDGILEHHRDGIRVTGLGRLFLRNVAMVFDEYLRTPGKATYSKTV